MKRRSLIKGAAAAAVCPFGCGKNTPAEEPTAREDETYVEFGARQSGKTSRLISAVADHMEKPKHLAVVLSPTHNQMGVLGGLASEWMRRAEADERSVVPQGRLKVFRHHFDGRGRTALAQWTEWMEKQIDNGSLQDENVRVFFDEWDFLNPSFYGEHKNLVPYLKGAYYTTTLRRSYSDREIFELDHNPTLRDLLLNVANVHLYQDITWCRFSERLLHENVQSPRLRVEGGQVFHPMFRPTRPLPTCTVHVPRVDPGTGLAAQPWDFEEAYISNNLKLH